MPFTRASATPVLIEAFAAGNVESSTERCIEPTLWSSLHAVFCCETRKNPQVKMLNPYMSRQSHSTVNNPVRPRHCRETSELSRYRIVALDAFMGKFSSSAGEWGEFIFAGYRRKSDARSRKKISRRPGLRHASTPFSGRNSFTSTICDD